MEEYWGNCLFPLFFAAGLVWTLLRHKKQVPRVFLYVTVFLFLTVYNPFLVKLVLPKLDFENEYYRFIWLLPVIPGTAYYAVRLISMAKKKMDKGFDGSPAGRRDPVHRDADAGNPG